MIQTAGKHDFPEKGENWGLELGGVTSEPNILPYFRKSRLVPRLNQPFADGASNPREQLPSLTINLVRPKVSLGWFISYARENSLF